MRGRGRRRGIGLRDRGSGSEYTSDEEFELREGDDVTSEDVEMDDSDAIDGEMSSDGSEVEDDAEEDEDGEFEVGNLKMKKVGDVKKGSLKNCDDDDDDEEEEEEGDEDEEEEERLFRRPHHRRKPAGKKKLSKTFEDDEDEERLYKPPPRRQPGKRRSMKAYEEEDEEERFDRLRRRRPSRKKRSLKAYEDEEEEETRITSRGKRWRQTRTAVSEEAEDEDDSDEDFSPEDEKEEVVKIVVRKKILRKRGCGRRRCGKKRGSGSVELVDEEEEEAGKSMLSGIRRRGARRGRKRKMNDVEVNDVSGIRRNRGRKKKRTMAANRHRKRRRASRTSDDDDDLDFVVENEVSVRGRSNGVGLRKSGGVKRRLRWRGSDFSESDLSDFVYVTSEDEIRHFPVMNPNCKKKRTERVSDKDKGKGKEVDDSGKQVCGICLSEEQRGVMRGILNSCAHFFCFACIMEWSKVESKCPVCKQRFTTISKTSVSNAILEARPTVVRVPKRDQVYQPSEEEMWGFMHPYENVVCMECLHGGDDHLMLLCDLCDSPAHTYCVGLGHEVPEGDWYCNGCRSAYRGQFNSQAQDRENGSISNHREFLQRLYRIPARATPARSEPLHEILQQSAPRVVDLGLSSRVPVIENNGIAQASGPSALTMTARRILSQRVRILLSSPDSRIRIASPPSTGTISTQLGYIEGDGGNSEVGQRRVFLEDLSQEYDERQQSSGLRNLRSDPPLMPCIRSYGESHL